MLAKKLRAPRCVSKPALSLTFFASKLAPTGVDTGQSVFLGLLHNGSSVYHGRLLRLVSH
ncbi:hypothetical protein METHPM2_2250003 [Pseudomonas sp. PM2]